MKEISVFDSLLPRPANVTPLEGDCVLGAFGSVTVEGLKADRLVSAAAQLSGLLPEGEGVPLQLRQRKGEAEAYTLQVNAEGVLIDAADEAGAFYALQTLRQMVLLGAEAGRLPAVRIEDSPDFSQRAYMLDVSRCKVPRLENLFAFIELLAQFKYNQLQLYIEHTFAWEGHEAVWGMNAALTPEDIKEIEAYCGAHFIELVPNMNCLGHYERWIRHPEYHVFADHPEAYQHPFGFMLPNGTTLKPEPQTQAFLGELIEEYLPCFSSKSAHIGGDEPWDLGLGWSKEICEQQGKHAVYLDHLNAVYAHASKHADRVLFWADVVLERPECVSQIPKALTPVIWGYEPDSPYAQQCALMRECGLDFWVAPSVRGYRSLIGNAAKWGNIPLAAQEGLRHGAQGALVTDWGDCGHHQMPFVSLPGLLWGGAVLWHSAAHQEEPELAQALNAFVFADSEGTSGQAVVALARVREVFAVKDPLYNPLHKMLFEEKDRLLPWLEENVSAEEMEAAGEALEGCRVLAEGACSPLDDGALLQEELLLSVELAQIALARARYLQKPEREGAIVLRQRLAVAIGRYEECWVARNRVGGLAESAGLLREVFDGLGEELR